MRGEEQIKDVPEKAAGAWGRFPAVEFYVHFI